MLIIVKDFTWSQSEDEVIIRVPLKNASSQIDVMTSENYIKIHAVPYFFEAFLLHPINEHTSRCQFVQNEARFYLKKQEVEQWDALERVFQDKAEKAKYKEEVLEKVQKNTQDDIKKRLEQKEEIKKGQVHVAIERDALIRESVEKQKKEACEAAMKKVEELKKTQKAIREAPKVKTIPKKKDPVIPEVRKSCTIDISFTKRNFVTPKRESQDPAEQEWMIKQGEARKSIGFVEEDLRPDERNPQWLKEKGDDFFHKKNYLAAISAYSTGKIVCFILKEVFKSFILGIRLADKYFELYLNRSAAHLALKNYQRCAEDCTKALELLQPPLDANLKPRVQCLARRGAALSQLVVIKFI